MVEQTQAAEEPMRDPPSGQRWEVSATPAQAGILRGLLADWAAARGASPGHVEDIRLAVYEAMTNVVRHAYPGDPHGTMTVTATCTDESLTVVVADAGRWRPATDSTGGGRGIPLMQALAPGATVSNDAGGTTVRLAWPTQTAPAETQSGEAGTRGLS